MYLLIHLSHTQILKCLFLYLFLCSSVNDQYKYPHSQEQQNYKGFIQRSLQLIPSLYISLSYPNADLLYCRNPVFISPLKILNIFSAIIHSFFGFN